MEHWSFVALAYGIVWSVIVVYFFFLKRRYRKAQMELSALTSAQRFGVQPAPERSIREIIFENRDF